MHYVEATYKSEVCWSNWHVAEHAHDQPMRVPSSRSRLHRRTKARIPRQRHRHRKDVSEEVGVGVVECLLNWTELNRTGPNMVRQPGPRVDLTFGLLSLFTENGKSCNRYCSEMWTSLKDARTHSILSAYWLQNAICVFDCPHQRPSKALWDKPLNPNQWCLLRFNEKARDEDRRLSTVHTSNMSKQQATCCPSDRLVALDSGMEMFASSWHMFASSSRGCHDDATRKLLPWNFSLCCEFSHV